MFTQQQGLRTTPSFPDTPSTIVPKRTSSLRSFSFFGKSSSDINLNTDPDLENGSLTSDASSSQTTMSSSPNPTTISSEQVSSVTGTPWTEYSITMDELPERSSTIRQNVNSKYFRDPWLQDFKHLETELSRFLSKSGVHKANVLRLALLCFLRQQKGLSSDFGLSSLMATISGPTAGATASSPNAKYKTKVLQKWWSNILLALKQRQVAGADRSAFLEALSGLLCRPEWKDDLTTYRELLCETLNFTISRLSQKTLAPSVSVFCGKVLAYCYFFIPGVAQFLLNNLNVQTATVKRIIDCSFIKGNRSWLITEDSAKNEQADDPMTVREEEIKADEEFIQSTIEEEVTNLRPLFFDYLSNIMGYMGGPKLSPPEETSAYVRGMMGSWVKRWASFNSDSFVAFIKHYYSIISMVFSSSSEGILKRSYTHLTAPGLLVLHSFMLLEFDHVVNKPERKLGTPGDSYDAMAVNAMPMVGKRRVDQLKVLMAIREILHNDDSTVQFYDRYCRQFENILHGTALSTRIHDVESCVVFADLAEEFISSLVLPHPSTRQQVQIFKDRAIDWEFWIGIAQRMMASENTNTALRALSFLFNIWDHIPIDVPYRRLQRKATNSTPDIGSCDSSMFGMDFDEHEGLRWQCTAWLLSIDVWTRYFCHWQPMVRAYYHRLLVWRIASVGNESDILCSILFSNHNLDARKLLLSRLRMTIEKVQLILAEGTKLPMEPSLPVAHRRLVIGVNPAADSSGTPSIHPTGVCVTSNIESVLIKAVRTASDLIFAAPFTNGGRLNAFEVFDDIAYSAGPVDAPLPCGIGSSEFFPREAPQQMIAAKIEKKRSSLEMLTSLFRKHSNKREKAEKMRGSSVTSLSKLASFSSLSRVDSISFKAYGSLPVSVTSSPGANCLREGQQSERDTVQPSEGLRHSKSESLTMALIPPPPTLTLKPPQIVRPVYKFYLDVSEASLRRQHDIILGIKTEPKVGNEAEIVGRLPFNYLGESESDSCSGYEGDDEQSPSTSPNTRSIRLSKVSPGKNRRQSDYEDVRYWRYAVCSLAEWQQCVMEFEEFVRSSKSLTGATRLEDIRTPFLVAEIPSKTFAG